MTELELIDQWRSTRDPRAFAEIVRRYAGMVFATCRRVLANDHDAEEIAQDCFALLAQHDGAKIESLGGWLHTLATRRSLDRARGDGRRLRRERHYGAGSASGSETAWDELRALVDECIEELPSQLRRPLVLYFLEGRTQEEVSALLGISQPTASRRIDKALEALRASFKKRGVTASVAGLSTGLMAQASMAAPPTLIATLGKLTLASAVTTVKPGALGIGVQTLGAMLTMKKAAIAAGIVATILAALFFSTQRPGGTDGPGPTVAIESSGAESRADSSVRAVAPAPESDDGLDAAGEDAPAFERVVAAAEALRESQSATGPGSASGRVVDARTRAPVSGVELTVTVASSDFEWTLKSDASGEFTLSNLDTGDYDVRIVEERLFPGPRPVPFFVVAGRETADLVVLLPRGGTVEGLITIGTEPAREMNFEITQLGINVNHGSRIVTTDREGFYAMADVLPGERKFFAMMDIGEGAELWSNIVRAAVVDEETTIVDFRFASGTAAIEGLMTVNGEPAPGESFVLVMYEGSGNEVLAQVALTSDAEGRYALTNAPVGNLVIGASVQMAGKSRVFGAHERVYLAPDETAVLDFDFEVGMGSIEGRVTRAGVPVAKGTIIMSGQFMQTDAEGFYRADNIPLGTAHLRAELLTETGKIYGTATRPVEIRAEKPARLDFDFPGGTASVQGFVRSDEDVPLHARVAAVFYSDNGNQIYHVAESRSDGHYRIEGLPAGNAGMIVWLADGSPIPSELTPLNLAPGQVVEQDIVVPSEFLAGH